MSEIKAGEDEGTDGYIEDEEFGKYRLTVFLPQEVKQSKKPVRSHRKSDFRRRSGG